MNRARIRRFSNIEASHQLLQFIGQAGQFVCAVIDFADGSRDILNRLIHIADLCGYRTDDHGALAHIDVVQGTVGDSEPIQVDW